MREFMMASLPPSSSSASAASQHQHQHQHQQRWRAQEETNTTSESSQRNNHGSSSPSSSTSSSSPSVVQISPSPSSPAPTNQASIDNVESQRHQQRPTQTPSSFKPPEEEPRKCWICYSDETEDDPATASEWRSPCPCALTAHESCLLDWVADLESPKGNKAAGSSGKVLCPQCKNEIVIARPSSLVVDGVRKVERIAGRLVLPGVGIALLGTVWAGCHAHGMITMYLVFGSEDSRRILGPLGSVDADGAWFTRANVGLPLIPLALIGSRTKYLDLILPVLPVVFFATNVAEMPPELDTLFWPPSAAMTFTALPYIKGIYNAVYERFFGPLERKWIAEVRPRAQEDDNPQQQQQQQQEQDNANPGDILLELQMDIQAHVDQMPDDDEARVRLDAARLEAEEAGLDNPANLNAGDAGDGGNQILGRRQNDIIIETSNLADSILGALLMPAVSAGVGWGLEYLLPKSWVTATADKGRAGILQSKWGRSVVGGCLFVVLKDALVLYCRWKLVQIHRQRTVMNYDRRKKGGWIR